jgi:hypothetical protein
VSQSRIKKTPALGLGVVEVLNRVRKSFCTQTNQALGASGDGGKRPTCGYFGPATILNLYKIAHSDKSDTVLLFASAPEMITSGPVRAKATSRIAP